MHIYYGYLIISIAIGFTIFCIMKKYEKLLLIISFCTIMIIVGFFSITQKRVTKLEFPGIGVIELTVGEETAFNDIIDILKTQIENDTLKLSKLKAKLDSTFTIDSSGQVQWHREQNIGNSYWGLNPGTVTTDYMTISSASSDGTTHGFNWQIGGYNIITATRDSDGMGDSDTPRININGVLELTPRSAAPTPAEEGLIYYDSDDHKLKVYNGSSWKIVTND